MSSLDELLYIFFILSFLSFLGTHTHIYIIYIYDLVLIYTIIYTCDSKEYLFYTCIGQDFECHMNSYQVGNMNK